MHIGQIHIKQIHKTQMHMGQKRIRQIHLGRIHIRQVQRRCILQFICNGNSLLLSAFKMIITTRDIY